VPTRENLLRWTALAAALLLLNFSLTFRNVWPTPAIRWTGAVSVELAVLIVALASLRRPGFPSRGWLRAIAAVWVVFVFGHYADVTAPALYGREINLYWDLRFVPAVTSMLVRATRIWLAFAAAVVLFLILAAFYKLLRWAIGRVSAAVGADGDPAERRVLVVLASAAVMLFALQRAAPAVPEVPVFSRPVVQTFARQASLVVDAMAHTVPIPASPPMNVDFSRVMGADVLLIFVESYGAVAFERPEFAKRLAPERAKLDAAIRDTNRDVVSAYVESPTFGGGSWLAHISLLSGIEVKDAATNARLMTAKRGTLVTAFARHGYRTVAMMPGMWQVWPEGAFYGFDEIYGGERLDYKGPEFGWWDIPDQFAIAKMDALELGAKATQPRFIFFPTVSTHIPFTPTPPYQQDWSRMLKEAPFNEPDWKRALAEQADWEDLGPGYANAVAYAYTAFAGYLRQRPDRDFIMILIGDHQPAALVSGEGASWNVPIHVIASRGTRQAVLDRLRGHGFKSGLTPSRPAIGHMHTLVPVLLDAFGDPEHP
jgi:hypothetical protein